MKTRGAVQKQLKPQHRLFDHSARLTALGLRFLEKQTARANALVQLKAGWSPNAAQTRATIKRLDAELKKLGEEVSKLLGDEGKAYWKLVNEGERVKARVDARRADGKMTVLTPAGKRWLGRD